MALKPKDIAEIVKLYNGGTGESVPALAEAYTAEPAAIRYQLKKAGVYKSSVADAETPSDEELGIQDEEGDTADASAVLADIMKNPALAALIDKAVNARLAQMSATPVQSMASAPTGEGTAVVKAIERLLEIQANQMPGYIKPLSADEVESRATATIEMKALIERARARGDAPHYTTGPQGLFDSTSVILYEPGSEIRTYLQPVEDFIPMNESARQIHAAFIRSLGGLSPDIGARVAEAMLASKEREVPLVGAPAQGVQGSGVELVQAAKRHDVSPKRVAGTMVPETRGTSMPVQPGVTQQPTGPVFVG